MKYITILFMLTACTLTYNDVDALGDAKITEEIKADADIKTDAQVSPV